MFVFGAQTLLLLLLLGAEAQRDNPIIFGDRNVARCRCVILFACASLLPVRGQSFSYSQAAEIRRRKCGYQGTTIKVCCPAEPTTPTHPTRPRYTGPTLLPGNCGLAAITDRIFGGTDAALGAHPWMAAIGYNLPRIDRDSPAIQFLCGGSLITRQHILTAAHCVHPQQLAVAGSKIVQINLGDWKLSTDPDCSGEGRTGFVCAPPASLRTPAAVTWHPRYNSDGNYNNDIALIRLDRPVQFGGFIQPICIPTSFTPRFDSLKPSIAKATGWGSTERGSESDILQEVRLPFVDMKTCNQSYLGRLNDNQFCTGGEDGRDSCHGDSGGPLISSERYGPPFLLVGLTSFGQGTCGRANKFGVYTAVSKYREWIEQSLPS